jgi:hypothetical protein
MPFGNLLISGVGITNNSGVTQNFSGIFGFTNSATAGSQNLFTINGPATSSEGGQSVGFSGSANAGNSTFILNGATVQSTGGGVMVFHGSSIAANATIIANGGVAPGGLGGDVQFWDTSRAGDATLIANDQAGSFHGGKIEFLGKSHGDTARVSTLARSLALPTSAAAPFRQPPFSQSSTTPDQRRSPVRSQTCPTARSLLAMVTAIK